MFLTMLRTLQSSDFTYVTLICSFFTNLHYIYQQVVYQVYFNPLNRGLPEIHDNNTGPSGLGGRGLAKFSDPLGIYTCVTSQFISL